MWKLDEGLVSFNASDYEMKKIGIENLADVISHRITKEKGNTIHELELINEGKCRIKITSQGKIVELLIDHMGITGKSANEVVLHQQYAVM
jgi:hypothetical protein